MSTQLKSILDNLYKEWKSSKDRHSFLDFVQFKRTGSYTFDIMKQGSTGLEIDNLLFLHHMRRI